MLTISELLKENAERNTTLKWTFLDWRDLGYPKFAIVLLLGFTKRIKWNKPQLEKEHISVADADGNLPSLESGMKSDLKNHFLRGRPKNPNRMDEVHTNQ